MGGVQMMTMRIFLLIVFCEIVYGQRGSPFDRSCPVPGRKNGLCVEPERCAVPVYTIYFGRYWRRRGVTNFCNSRSRRSARRLICCLRTFNRYTPDDERPQDRPNWTIPENKNAFWNGTNWIDEEDDVRQSEDIVATDPVYQSKCAEYTAIASNVENSISTAGPIFRTMIVGGLEASAKEYPHMALLGFGTADNINWRCGGSLISEKFVMTAAHCLHTQDLGDIQFARLGDLDINSQADDAQPQQFNIVQRYRHPAYVASSHYNDIALLQLDRPVTFTKYVRPACLPTDDDLTNAQLIATGWGALEYTGTTSSTLMKVDLRYYSTEQCQEAFPPQARLDSGIHGDSQICAGGVNEQKDTCQGDSGGPLQIKTSSSPYMYKIVGITSFGRACGIMNLPAVYTKVSFFVPWIEQIVWANGL